MEKLRLTGHLTEEIFAKYDPEANGYVTKGQFLKVLDSLGLKLDDQSV
jgi:Ca2+-binding EF-hand superfamily protein